MIDVLRQQFTAAMSAEEKTNRVREFLQILVLKILADKGFFRNLAFVGGTALRILYDLRRFSEDLDFSLMDKKGYNFETLVALVRKELTLFGIESETTLKGQKVVQSAFVKFPGLLHELGIAMLKDQKLSIRVEIDSHPPAGAVTETTLVNKTYLLSILRFDLPSMYATKLHACFFRTYTKGRDFYDLVWYLGKHIEPNYRLLNNAIRQTHGRELRLTADNFHQFLTERLQQVDFRAVRKDVERFLEDKTELELLDRTVLRELISR
jgi:predicted nucleotidyltransferase component of viral defense system